MLELASFVQGRDTMLNKGKVKKVSAQIQQRTMTIGSVQSFEDRHGNTLFHAVRYTIPHNGYEYRYDACCFWTETAALYWVELHAEINVNK